MVMQFTKQVDTWYLLIFLCTYVRGLIFALLNKAFWPGNTPPFVTKEIGTDVNTASVNIDIVFDRKNERYFPVGWNGFSKFYLQRLVSHMAHGFRVYLFVSAILRASVNKFTSKLKRFNTPNKKAYIYEISDGCKNV